MSSILAYPRTLARRKPLGRSLDIRADLKAYATSIWAMKDGGLSVQDVLRGNHLIFGSSSAAPAWGESDNGGQGLRFDGTNDTAINTALSIGASAFPFWIACVFSPSSITGTAQVGFSLGASSGSPGAFCSLGIGATGVIDYRFRGVTAGTAAQVTGQTVIANSLVFLTGISRGITDHSLFAFGEKFVSATSVTSFSNTLNRAAAGLIHRGADADVQYLNGITHFAAYGVSDPGDDFLRALSVDPYQMLFAPVSKIRTGVAGAPIVPSRFYYDLSKSHHV